MQNQLLILGFPIEAAGEKPGPANKALPALGRLLDAHQDALFGVLPELILF